MYTCHVCGLKTNNLNGLMSRHWRSHCGPNYGKSQYKRDLLSYNGRPPKRCGICGEYTEIPRGGSQYPNFHKACYLSYKLRGKENPNFKSGKTSYVCPHCGDEFERYSSSVVGEYAFCSYACSTTYYVLRRGITSNVERSFFEYVRTLYPDAVSQHQVGRYLFDIYVPSTGMLVEVNGNYWHTMPETIRQDNRKRGYIEHHHPELTLRTVWEDEIVHLGVERSAEYLEKNFDTCVVYGDPVAGVDAVRVEQETLKPTIRQLRDAGRRPYVVNVGRVPFRGRNVFHFIGDEDEAVRSIKRVVT